MTSKITIIILSFLLMQACGEDPIEPNLPSSQNYNLDGTEVLVENGSFGISNNCTVESTESCNLARVNVCLECEICKTNTEFSDIGFIEILVENQDTRTLTSYGTFELDQNYELTTNLCIPKNMDQTSHIIAFNLLVSNTAPSFQNVAFNNIDLDLDSPTNINKVISSDQFDDTNCKTEPIIVFSSDPTSEENINKSYVSCIIGSLGDCNENGPIEDASNWEEKIEATKLSFEFLYANYATSTPCSGIYFKFKD